jgi:hypothetical protein
MMTEAKQAYQAGQLQKAMRIWRIVLGGAVVGPHEWGGENPFLNLRDTFFASCAQRIHCSWVRHGSHTLDRGLQQ